MTHPIPDLTWSDHARAILVALHLLAVGIMAFPSPSRVTPAQLTGREAQRVLADWRDGMSALGVSVSRAESEAWVLGFANSFMDARQVLLRPFRPYYALAGTGQSWKMFGMLNQSPGRVLIELNIDGAWLPVYRARDPELTWNARQLDSERFRAMLNDASWGRNKKGYIRFVNWLSCVRVPVLSPEAGEVRVSVERLFLPEPAELRDLRTLPVRQVGWQEVRTVGECSSSEGTP